MTANSLQSAGLRALRSVPIVLGAVAVLSGAAAAQGDGPNECARAATVVRAYDESAVNSGGRAAQGQGKAEERQIAAARLLSCGAVGGVTAAATIRNTRSMTDTSTLNELVGPFRNFRDTAVVSAVTSIARDPSASVEARVFALRAIWVLRTGKIWISYDRMLPTEESTAAEPLAACDHGLTVSHEVPAWTDGVLPPPGFEDQLKIVADQLFQDSSQPMAVRAAARCARMP